LFLSVFLHDVSGVSPFAGGESGATGLDLASPLLFGGAVAGLGLVLAFDWMVLGRIVSASRDLVHELRLQLLVGEEGARALERGMLGLRTGEGASGRGLADGGSDRGHLACVEIVSRIALRGMIAPAA